jgi:uncharacterized protein (DUF433 family)
MQAIMEPPVTTVSSIDQYIVVTPGISGGRPRLNGHRITVYDIAFWRLKLGMALEEIAGEYDLPLAAVYAAMAYYYDHRQQIDERAKQDLLFAEEFQKQHPARLKTKLREKRELSPLQEA